MYLPKLKKWLISSLAFKLFCEFQILNYTMVMSDLGKALMTLSFTARVTSSNRPELLMKLVMSLLVSLLLLG